MNKRFSILTTVHILTTTLLVGSLFGCATIVSKSKYPVAINSTPDGANITVVDKSGGTVFSGITPTTVTLKSSSGFFSKATYAVTFEKEGYSKQIARIEATLDGWYIGNVCIGWFPGFLLIDPLSGSMWKLDESVHASLTRSSISSVDEDGLHIVFLDDVPNDLRQHLVKIN